MPRAGHPLRQPFPALRSQTFLPRFPMTFPRISGRIRVQRRVVASALCPKPSPVSVGPLRRSAFPCSGRINRVITPESPVSALWTCPDRQCFHGLADKYPEQANREFIDTNREAYIPDRVIFARIRPSGKRTRTRVPVHPSTAGCRYARRSRWKDGLAGYLRIWPA